MPNYNISFLNESNGVAGVMEGVNNMSDGLYAALILLVLFIILFIAMKRYDTDVAFLTASFVCSVIATLLSVLEWIGVEIFVVPVVLLIIAIFYKVANK